jgi:hypothetical protein
MQPLYHTSLITQIQSSQIVLEYLFQTWILIGTHNHHHQNVNKLTYPTVCISMDISVEETVEVDIQPFYTSQIFMSPHCFGHGLDMGPIEVCALGVNITVASQQAH